MLPLIVLVSVFTTILVVTLLRNGGRDPDIALSLRGSLGAMFLITGISHFAGMTTDFVKMVPSWLPAPEFLVMTTGMLEIASAVAMLSRRLTPWAALCLTALLIAMFPANINLALSGADLPWSQTLIPRTLIQVIFVTATSSLVALEFKRAATGGTKRSDRTSNPSWQSTQAPRDLAR